MDGMTALTVQTRLLLNQQILPNSTKSLDSLEGSLDVIDGNIRSEVIRFLVEFPKKQLSNYLFIDLASAKTFKFKIWTSDICC